MKKLRFSILLLISFLIIEEARAESDTIKNLVVLYTNDLHNHITGFSNSVKSPLPGSDYSETKGGYARIATLIENERKKAGNNVLVLDAGDFLIGTFFSMLEESSGFQLSIMKKMGYDAVTLGNHEFDFGPQILASIITKSAENGYLPSVLASNLSFSAKDHGDDALNGLFDKQIIKPYQIIEIGGLKIGIFGIMGKGAVNVAPMIHPVQFEDPVKIAQEYAKLLKGKEKADLVICISHSGIHIDENGKWAGEDASLARQVPDIDLIISGHTHILLENPAIVNGIPILCAGSYGAWLGRCEVEVAERKIKKIDSKVIQVTDVIPQDSKIQNLIAEQEYKISEQILKPCHLFDTAAVTETSFPLICNEDTMLENSNLGPLISDAIYSYFNTGPQPGTDITFFPAGLVADNLMPRETGKQTVADIFRIVPLGYGKDNVPGYPLARVYVTGKELKGIMEILYMAPSRSRDFYMYTDGLRAAYNPRNGLLRKVTSVEIGNQESGFLQVDCSKRNKKLYSVTADSYVLGFASQIGKLTRHLINVSLKNERGEHIKSIDDAIIDADPDKPGIQEIKAWMTLLWFLRQQPDINGNGIADIPDCYRTGSPERSLYLTGY
jgi:5'-nucleotidase / UDP-sugar diphosphatase